MTEKIIWGIHMSSAHGLTPIENGYIAISWSDLGDLSTIKPNREAFKAAFIKAYPNTKQGTIPVAAGVNFRFAVEMKLGDIVIFPSKPDRMVNIGVIDGPYHFVKNAPCDCPQQRPVKWLKHLPRAVFSQAALNEIGSAVTLFQVSTNAQEFLAALEGHALQADEIDEASAEHVSEQVELSTEDFIIKRLKTSQSPFQFEHFIAHLLKCMGYFSRVTQASGDGGIDIIAHKDELGFEPPIIKVQCKQTLTTIGRPEVQKLFGAIEREEKGLFVTLGSFSSDARTYEQTKANLRLIDGHALIDLIYIHYHKFEPRYQMLLPLKRSFIPGPVLIGSD
jgi:restriction system protein